jgi:hypothetical protein
MENNKVIQQMGSSDEKERNKKNRPSLYYQFNAINEITFEFLQ